MIMGSIPKCRIQTDMYISLLFPLLYLPSTSRRSPLTPRSLEYEYRLLSASCIVGNQYLPYIFGDSLGVQLSIRRQFTCLHVSSWTIPTRQSNA